MIIIPKDTCTVEYRLKKSRFIAQLGAASSKEDVKQAIADSREKFPDAGHHCWAYLLGSADNGQAGMNDDGEPSGTAGKPILNVLMHSGYGNIVAVVARYFGGVKLGASGLVRAYGSATQEALEQLSVVQYYPHALLEVCCAYHQENDLRYLVSRFEGAFVDLNYQAELSAQISVEIRRLDEFLFNIKQLSKGQMRCRRLDNERD